MSKANYIPCFENSYSFWGMVETKSRDDVYRNLTTARKDMPNKSTGDFGSAYAHKIKDWWTISSCMQHSTSNPTMARTSVIQTNYNEIMFQKAEESLARLMGLDEDEYFHLGHEAGQRALQIVAFIKHSISISAPKILPEGEDDVALTWEDELVKRYVSISPDSVEIVDQNKNDPTAVTHYVGDDNGIDYQGLIAHMGSPLKSSTTKSR